MSVFISATVRPDTTIRRIDIVAVSALPVNLGDNDIAVGFGTGVPVYRATEVLTSWFKSWAFIRDRNVIDDFLDIGVPVAGQIVTGTQIGQTQEPNRRTHGDITPFNVDDVILGIGAIARFNRASNYMENNFKKLINFAREEGFVGGNNVAP